jgi:hypothetical protein
VVWLNSWKTTKKGTSFPNNNNTLEIRKPLLLTNNGGFANYIGKQFMDQRKKGTGLIVVLIKKWGQL